MRKSTFLHWAMNGENIEYTDPGITMTEREQRKSIRSVVNSHSIISTVTLSGLFKSSLQQTFFSQYVGYFVTCKLPSYMHLLKHDRVKRLVVRLKLGRTKRQSKLKQLFYTIDYVLRAAVRAYFEVCGYGTNSTKHNILHLRTPTD